MSEDPVLFEVVDRVALITLNRPEQLNAWNGPLNRGLEEALGAAADDAEVGAVVITGAGRAFCAGADLAGGGDTFAPDAERDAHDDVEARTPGLLPWDIPKPVLAAINGHAVGVGATYALACDIRIASDAAKIGFVFTRRGMLSELGSHAILPSVVGMSNAADLLMSGRVITGVEAEAMGLVSAALPSDQVLEQTMARAADMANNAAPVSMAISKRLLWEGLGLEEMRRREEPLFEWVSGQDDAVEGVESFLEKRQPAWGLTTTNDFPEEFFT